MKPRRSVRLGWFVFFLIASLVATQLPLAARADDDPNRLLKQIQDLERAITVSRQNAERYKQASQQYRTAASAAASRIEELAEQQRSAQSEAEEAAAELGIAEEQLSLVALQLNETIAYENALTAAIDEGAKMLARREDLYGQHLRQMYRQSRASPLEMLLASNSLADFAERVQLMTAIARADQQLASDIRKLRASKQEKRVTAELKQKEIEGLKALVIEQRDRLAKEKAHLDELIEETGYAKSQSEAQRAYAIRASQSAQSAARNAQLQAADLERRKLAAESMYASLVAGLQRAGAPASINRPWSGLLSQWPLSGPLTSYFGPRWGGFHNGVDIAAPMYTPIRAANAGYVQIVGRPYLASGDTAEVLIIAHASNMSTLYGHVDDSVRAPIVRPGQYVQAGQIIAYVGMTGWTTGPHLHFMTVYNGKAVDPLQFLPR